MSESCTFPLNAWYAAAWDTEVGRSLFPRTICEIPVILYRRRDGVVAAMEDSCWHRMAPLSMGRLDGDNVVCGYHGLVFNPEGRCVRMPSQETLNPSACVRSFPVVERHRFVWLWMGDPALADPAKVPDLHWNDDPDWSGDGRTIHGKCNYRLVVDNLMDLTHEAFVHGSSIGNDAVAETPFEVTHNEKFAYVSRWMMDIDPPPFWKSMLGKPGKVDRWQLIRFEPPCTVAIDVGVAPADTGAPQGDRSQGVNGHVLNTATPETESTCHYFWNVVRNWRLHDQRLTNEIREAITRVFREDEIMLEAQQKGMERHPNRGFFNLNIDGGSLWARKLIAQMVEAERPKPRLAAE
jgi:phenylpropionate dioxygenase-like ring-hydroxylating dioxygenase large terminal subunit